MNGWTDRPPAPTEFAGIRLIRCAPNKELIGIITSDRLVGHNTHFAHRRTQPCTGPDCSLCLDGQPARWHGYLSILSPYSDTQYVVELTALAAAPIADYQDRHGSLRGARLHLKRIGNAANSPVRAECQPHDSDLRKLPRGVHLQKYLSVLWQINHEPSTPTQNDENQTETSRPSHPAP